MENYMVCHGSICTSSVCRMNFKTSIYILNVYYIILKLLLLSTDDIFYWIILKNKCIKIFIKYKNIIYYIYYI